jgi:hypothetical protein
VRLSSRKRRASASPFSKKKTYSHSNRRWMRVQG